MSKFFRPLLALIASATRKKLLDAGRGLGKAIEELISIVSPKTFSRWLHEGNKGKESIKPKGCPRKNRDIRELVVTIARETGFGYTRIVGEMTSWAFVSDEIRCGTFSGKKTLHLGQIGNPRYGATFSIVSVKHFGHDFFSVRTVTWTGLRKMYMLVFLCLETREPYVTPATLHPNSAWVSEETTRFLHGIKERDKPPKYILHDRDTKCTDEFVQSAKAAGAKAVALPVQSPNLNGRCERFIGTLKGLHLFLVFGDQHLDYLVNAFLMYYNHTRSHSSRECIPPLRTISDNIHSLSVGDVELRSHVGGLVKSFERKAA